MSPVPSRTNQAWGSFLTPLFVHLAVGFLTRWASVVLLAATCLSSVGAALELGYLLVFPKCLVSGVALEKS